MLITPPRISSPSAIIPGIDGTIVFLRRLFLSGLMLVAVMYGFTAGGAHAALSGDSSLSRLVVTPGVLDFDVSAASRNYTACVPAGTTSLTINPVVTHPLATVRVNGVPVPSGDGGVAVDLANGGGLATVEVTGEDSTSSIYTITIITGKGIDTTYSSGTHVPATYPALDASGLPLQLKLGHRPEPGADLRVVDITGLNFIKGRFCNLAQGQEVTLEYDGTKYYYCADYYGGTGNDLVLHWLRTGISTWGSNSSGQLGNDRLDLQSRVPTAVANAGALAGKTVVSVSAGGAGSYALCSDGTIAAWGSNNAGELGNGSVTSSSIPVAVTMTGVLAGKTVISISAGYGYCLALCSDGTVAGWGSNSSGLIGDGGSSGNKITPVMVSNTGVLKGKTVVAVSAGILHSLALCSDGTVAAWGINMKGALGVAAPASSNVPVLVETSGVLAGRRVVGISADGTYSFPFSLAVCSDGRVVAWGANEYGQLGNGGAAAGGFSPTLVDNTGVLSGRSVVEVSTGKTHVVARCADGTVAAWGGNIYGQLGNNSIVDSPVPLKVDDTGVLSGREVTSVVTGEYSSLALCSDGSVVGWGINSSSQLGDSGTTHRRVPVLMAAQPDGGKVKAVSAGYYHGMALTPVLPDPELTSLAISEGAFTPAFSPGTTSYLYRAQTGASRLSISAKARDAAEMTVNLLPLPSGTPTEVSLKAGMNTAVVRVSAANGAVKDYTIHILVGDQMGISFDSPSVFPIPDLNSIFPGSPRI